MGNLTTSSGGVAIILEPDLQIANSRTGIPGGSILRGRICLSIEASSVRADTLNVKFYGNECTQVSYSITVDDGEGKSHSETRTSKESSSIISLDRVLYNFEGKLERGRYEYPFELTLPYGLPGKQGSKDGSDYYVIEYFIEARLHRHGIMTWDIKNALEIFLLDPPQTATKIPSFIEPMTTPLFFFCCFKTGTATIQANVDSVNVFTGDYVTIEYGMVNESSSTIKAIEIRIHRINHFHANGHFHDSNVPVVKERLTPEALNMKTNSRKESNSESIYGSIVDDVISKNTRKIKIAMPYERSSLVGRLGTIRYEIVVQLMTSTCVQNPSLTIPIRVFRTKYDFEGFTPAVEIPFEKPNDWLVPSAPPMMNLDALPVAQAMDCSTLTYLITLLDTANQWSEVATIQEWLTYCSFTELIPPAIGAIFRKIKGEHSYAAIAEVLGRAMRDAGQPLTCQHVLAAARVSPLSQRPIICIQMSSFCTKADKNLNDFSSLGLSPSALNSVLACFQEQ